MGADVVADEGMRFLKRLLICIYAYGGIFGIVCFIAWLITGNLPDSLIVGVYGALGIESVVGGMMKIREVKAEKERAELEVKMYNQNNVPPEGGESEQS